MRTFLLATLAAFAFSSLLVVAPAKADGAAAVNLASNTLFGWTECGKAVADEAGKAAERAYVGVLVTAPLMCGVNVAVRYLGVIADIVTLRPLWDGNTVTPAVHESWKPPVQLP